MSFSLKCEDTLGLSTPTWSLDEESDFGDVANVKSVNDLSLTVISLNWALISEGVTRVRCGVRRHPRQAAKRRCGASYLVRTKGARP